MPESITSALCFFLEVTSERLPCSKGMASVKAKEQMDSKDVYLFSPAVLELSAR